MYHTQPATHNFSPQRRQILGGANKRLSPAKAQLGNDEAISVGPGKLFADLKQQTSSKKASSSTSVFAKSSKSRAFGQEKSNRSPERSAPTHDAGEVPVKPQQSTRTENQLISPSKASKKAESIFLASSSPTKRKKVAVDSEPKQKTPVLPSIELAESHPQRPQLFTPEANVGQAGAIRQRLGEMLDAMAKGDVSVDGASSAAVQETELLDDEDLYPEIEFMPSKVEVPYDFPPELDGMPRANEMAELLKSMQTTGFYRTEPGSLLEVEDGDAERHTNVERLNVTLKAQDVQDGDAQFWPNSEVKESDTNTEKKVHERTKPSIALHKGKVGFRGASSSLLSQQSRLKPPPSTGRTQVHLASRQKPQTGAVSKIPKAKKPLLEKNGNTTTLSKQRIHPALSDFKNDHMGKIAQQKLAAYDESPAEGFTI